MYYSYINNRKMLSSFFFVFYRSKELRVNGNLLEHLESMKNKLPLIRQLIPFQFPPSYLTLFRTPSLQN